MKRIQSNKHKLGTYEINKISLSCFDNKRYELDDGVYMLAYFHKDCDDQKDCYHEDCNYKDCNHRKIL